MAAAKEAPKKPEEKKDDKKEMSVHARIDALEEEIKSLEKEMRIMEGMLKNRRPEVIKALQQENEQLKVRAKYIEGVLLKVMADAEKPRHNDELTIKFQALKEAAIRFFKKEKIDANVWKNIESS